MFADNKKYFKKILQYFTSVENHHW